MIKIGVWRKEPMELSLCATPSVMTKYTTLDMESF